MTRPQPSAEESLDHLAGDWRIFQLKKGHRFSTDDLMTAWVAAQSRPDSQRLLDLGSGIGSVGLLTLWRMETSARLTTLEVQTLSTGLARRTVEYNGLQSRVQIWDGDLRDPLPFPASPPFDLITGSPPYIPAHKGVQSPHPQKAAARIELHGDVFDYCRTAAQALAPDGRFCFCHAAADPRPEPAIEAAGLRLLQRRDVVFRADQPPLIALFVCALSGERRDAPPFFIRGNDGQWTDEYLAMRAAMGTVVWRKEA